MLFYVKDFQTHGGLEMDILFVFLIVCIGVAFQAGHQIFQKFIYNQKSASIRQTLLAQNATAAVVLGGLSMYLGFSDGWESLLPDNPLWFWSAVGMTTLASIYIQWANAKARLLADVSLTAPISALTPGLVAITALLLGEVPSAVGWIGIIVVAVGTYWFGLGERAHSYTDLFRPFILLWLPSNFETLSPEEKTKARQETLALRLSYGVAAMGTVGLISDALVVRNGSMTIGFLVYSIILFLLFLRLSKRDDVAIERQSLVRLVKLGILWTFHILVVFSMYAYAHVAYVGTLKRLSVVFVALGGYFFLQELNARRRLIPIVVITIGAILLGLDDSMTDVIKKIEH
jgi:drug/metabolite transporter (DMT)-like permease